MAAIEVTRGEREHVFRVEVREGRGASEHQVTLKPSDFARLKRAAETEEAFLRRCFEFLLAREPKESILGSFDVTVIGRYFPEFEAAIRRETS
jgi:hypothetical protein